MTLDEQRRQKREVRRAAKKQAQRRDVRAEANMRPNVTGSRPDVLADAIGRLFFAKVDGQ